MRNYVAAQDVARKVLLRKFRFQPCDVEDILQDAVVKAIVHEDQFRGRAQFNTWFTSIAIRQALMRLRTYRSVQLCELQDVYEDNRSSPMEEAAREERSRKLHEAARRLSPALRQEFPSYLAGEWCGDDSTRKGARFRLRKRLRMELEGIV